MGFRIYPKAVRDVKEQKWRKQPPNKKREEATKEKNERLKQTKKDNKTKTKTKTKTEKEGEKAITTEYSIRY